MCELLPCPFCGGEARGIADGYVFCDCGASAPIEAWNTRAEPQKVAIANVTFTQEQLDEIKEYCLRNLAGYTPAKVVG